MPNTVATDFTGTSGSTKSILVFVFFILIIVIVASVVITNLFNENNSLKKQLQELTPEVNRLNLEVVDHKDTIDKMKIENLQLFMQMEAAQKEVEHVRSEVNQIASDKMELYNENRAMVSEIARLTGENIGLAKENEIVVKQLEIEANAVNTRSLNSDAVGMLSAIGIGFVLGGFGMSGTFYYFARKIYNAFPTFTVFVASILENRWASRSLSKPTGSYEIIDAHSTDVTSDLEKNEIWMKVTQEESRLINRQRRGK
jgi:cell division protein FtsB